MLVAKAAGESQESYLERATAVVQEIVQRDSFSGSTTTEMAGSRCMSAGSDNLVWRRRFSTDTCLPMRVS